MNFNTRKYIELLTDTIPRVIETEAEYERLEVVFEHLLDKGENRSPEETAMFDLLTKLLEDYERRSLEPISDLTPVQLLKSLMIVNGLKQKDLAATFGGQSVVSDILNGRREINKEQAKKLSDRFSISVSAFV